MQIIYVQNFQLLFWVMSAQPVTNSFVNEADKDWSDEQSEKTNWEQQDDEIPFADTIIDECCGFQVQNPVDGDCATPDGRTSQIDTSKYVSKVAYLMANQITDRKGQNYASHRVNNVQSQHKSV